MALSTYTVTSRSLYAWGVGQMGHALMICVFGQVLMIFTREYGMGGGLVGSVVVLAHLFSAAADPLLGHWSDNTHSRFGRRKPYMVGGAALGAVMLPLMFAASPSWGQGWLFLHLLITATVLCVSWGAFSMAHGALGYELTDSYHQRTKVQAVSGLLFAGIVYLSAGEMYRIYQWDGFTSVLSGIRWVSLAVAAMVIASALVTSLFCQERFAQRGREHRQDLKAALRELSRNTPFRRMVLMRLISMMGERLYGTIALVIALYYVCGGDRVLFDELAGWPTRVGLLWGLVVFPFMTGLSRVIGKRRGMLLSTGVTVLVAVLNVLLLTPIWPQLMLVPALLFAPLLAIGGTLFAAMVPDICDLDELESGRRREGLISAILSLVSKLSLAACVLIGGLMVSLSGTVQTAATQTPDVLERLRWFAHTPAIVFGLIAFIMALSFPLTEQRITEIREQLDGRRRMWNEPDQLEEVETAQ